MCERAASIRQQHVFPMMLGSDKGDTVYRWQLGTAAHYNEAGNR